jgi:hypothetical protein
MNTRRFSNRSIPLAFLILTVLTYGPLLPWLGLYWDDWPFLWNVQQRGAAEVIGIFEHSRPFLWPIAWLTTSLIPATPLAWQIFGLFMRLITGLSAWFCLQTVWPASRRHVLTASLFFLIYPAFTQQWLPVTYTNQHFIPLSACLLSLGISIRAARQPQKFWRDTLLAIGLQAAGLLPTEYFLGLELLRPLFLWQVSEHHSTAWQRGCFVFKRWLPYLAIWMANLFWLICFYQSGEYRYYDPAGLTEFKYWYTGLNRVQDLGASLLKGGVLGWFEGLKSLWSTWEIAWLAAVIMVATFLFAQHYQKYFNSGASPADKNWAYAAIMIGLVGMLGGRLPSWAASLPLRFNFGWDRFFLPMILGSSLFLSGLLALIKSEARRIALASLVIALAAGQHIGHAYHYQKDWNRQQAFFWQLIWRAPGIRPQTVILAPDLQLAYETDLSLTAPLNWIYAPENTTDRISYLLLYPELRLGGPKLPRMEENLPIKVAYATTIFEGTTSQAIVIYFPAQGGCLKILDAVYNNQKAIPNLPPSILPALALSHPDRILPEAQPPLPPPAIFGREPKHDWCYYYQKAELARQASDWAGVVRAGRAALNQGYHPHDPAEWLLFIEGYAHTGSLSSAEELSMTVWREAPYLKNALCQRWRRLGNDADVTPAATMIRQRLNCKP